MSTSLRDDTKNLSNKMIDLPCWLFDEHLTSMDIKKTIVLSPKKRKENNVQIMPNSKIKNSVFLNKTISTLIKIFTFVCQIFGIIVATIYSFVKQRMIPEQKNDSSILRVSQTETHVQNLNNIMASLRMYASEAENEHKHVSSHFKSMKTRIEKQEEILDKNLVEINDLKARVNEAELNSDQQNKVIKSLGEELEKNKEQLLNAENKFASITKQLRSSVSSEPANELQIFNESDEDYIFIINHIRDMKFKIQYQENHLASILQLINKLDELHDFNKTIDQQTKSIINLKDGLRRKSANIFESLKNIVGRGSESICLDDSAESEDVEVFDESLNVIEQNAKSFIEDVDARFEILGGNKGHFIQPQRRFSDALKQNLSFCVIQNSTQIPNISIAPIENVSACQSTMIAKNVTTFEKGIQTSINVECNDAGCQTTESLCGNYDSSVSSVKNMMQKTLDNFNSLQERHGRMRETLDAYKFDKSQFGKPCDKSIKNLEKEVAAFKTQINEKDSKIVALTEKLQLVDELTKEKAKLKELLDATKEENYNLKDEIAKLSLSEQEKDQKVAVLEEDLNVTKQSYENNIAFLTKEADNMNKDIMLLNQKLLTEKENIKNLKLHYNKVNQHLQDQVKTNETTIASLRMDHDMLRNTYDALDKMHKETNVQYSNTIKKKDATIHFYKLANETQSAEIKNLKEEVKQLSILPHGEKDKYPRTALQENVQRYRSRSNSKEYDGNSKIPTNFVKGTFPNLHSNITYRVRSSPTDRRK
ncbi:putative leucine-rich repeat-containing protein DDB_G0290503 isoform X1 [Nasonia vitripennis]|uniref:Uncharacterized protein n=1 Tax=Nasonia vitripennis TaxID=7425 RepID=A0A7M7GD46_NASVI|nr:putative leucine-rich repeat-containing protein DDB_G0290503 isoform X1 [Nasonia vitripennis]